MIFFNIHNQEDRERDIFNDFSNIFARCIPEEKVVEKDERLTRQIQGEDAREQQSKCNLLL
ncbi:MAG: hypothetical protein ACLRZG_03110 [Streptococcus sp.]